VTLIIGLIDSICEGITMETQYINKSLKISEKSYLLSLYNSIPFIFECFHDQQDSYI